MTKRLKGHKETSIIKEAVPTLIFPTTVSTNETAKLVRQIVKSIAHYTDYNKVGVLLIGSDDIAVPHIAICSEKVPQEAAVLLKVVQLSAEKLINIIESGKGIKIDELGFASYYPPSHHEFLGELSRIFELFNLPDDDPQHCNRANSCDGLIVPIINRLGQLFGIILLGAPRSGTEPNRESILPILAFANQIAQILDHDRHDKLLSGINEELTAEKEKLVALLSISSKARGAESFDAKLETVVKGIEDLGWKHVSLYLYGEEMRLKKLIQNEAAKQLGRAIAKDSPPEHLSDVVRRLEKDWNYEGCYYLRYSDTAARLLIADLLGEAIPDYLDSNIEKTSAFWNPYDLLLVPLHGRDGRLLGLTHVAFPIDSMRPGIESLNILRLCARECALIVEQLMLDAERERLYDQARDQAEREAQHSFELRQTNEKLQELENIRSDFTATLVHDIRSPLSVILNTLELIQLTQKNPNTKIPNMPFLIDSAQNTCKQIVTMINELLDLSRIESAGLILNKKPVHPRELIDSVVQECVLLANRKKINLNFGCGPDLKSFMADATYLKRALANLLTNAVKFTPEGGQIWFEARPVKDERISEGTVYIMFTVIDSGPGIPAEDLPFVFDAYYKASNNKSNLSTGLGLAIVKRIAAAHGGNISVKSQQGIGSSFSLLIPMTETDIIADPE